MHRMWRRIVCGAALLVMGCGGGPTGPSTSPSLAKGGNANVFYSDTVVTISGAVVAFQATCSGLNCKFINLSTSPYPWTSQSWVFGCGEGCSGGGSNHFNSQERFPGPGTYGVILFQRDAYPSQGVVGVNVVLTK